MLNSGRSGGRTGISNSSPTCARRRTLRTPKLRHHKATGHGFVELNGHRHYLGPYGSDKAQQRYHRLLAEWTAHGGRLPVAQDEITVTVRSPRIPPSCSEETGGDTCCHKQGEVTSCLEGGYCFHEEPRNVLLTVH
mgnify:CR=1 FL=1